MIENPPVITDAIYPMQIMQIMSAPVYQDLLLKIEKEYLLLVFWVMRIINSQKGKNWRNYLLITRSLVV